MNDLDKNRKLKFFQRFKKGLQYNINIDPGRIMALTDGIFGMVMTLLIFAMALPEMEIASNAGFVNFIYSILPTIGITLVSFFLLSSFWICHHEFIKIDKLDLPYLWLNILFLATISFIPFTTSLIGNYSQFFLAEVIFGLNILLSIIIFSLMFSYANKRGFLKSEIGAKEKKYIHHTLLIIMASTVAINLLDFNLNSNFIYLFLLIPIISTLRDIQFRMKKYE